MVTKDLKNTTVSQNIRDVVVLLCVTCALNAQI